MKRIKKTSKLLKVLSVGALAGVATLSLASCDAPDWLPDFVESWFEGNTNQENPPLIDGEEGNVANGIPKNVVFREAKAESQITINANVLPDSATDKTLTWSLSWASSNGSEKVEDYISQEIINETHTIKLTVKKPFSVPINLEAKTKDNVKATCKLDFLKFVENQKFSIGRAYDDHNDDVIDGSDHDGNVVTYKFNYAGENTIDTVAINNDPVFKLFNVLDSNSFTYYMEQGIYDDYWFEHTSSTSNGTVGTTDTEVKLEFNEAAKTELKKAGFTEFKAIDVMEEMCINLNRGLPTSVGGQQNATDLGKIIKALATLNNKAIFTITFTCTTTYQEVSRVQTISGDLKTTVLDYVPTSGIEFGNGNNVIIK